MFSDDILREKFRSSLKQARIEADLRQSDVAEALQKPQSYVAKIESGERKLELVEAISYCEAIGVDICVLIRALSK